MDEESRAKRTKALEEKKRRLEELKRRRQAAAAASSAPAKSTSTGTSTGNLDDYIDGLLNNPIPAAPGISPSPQTETVGAASGSNLAGTSAAATSTLENAALVSSTSTATSSTTTAAVSSSASAAPVTPVKKVETFTAGTQTEEDEFPPELIAEEDEKQSQDSSNEMGETPDANLSEPNESDEAAVQILSPEEKEKAISSDPFGSFFIHASKKVERLLGAPVLADLLVDTEYDDERNGLNIDEDQKEKQDSSKQQMAEKDDSYGLVSGRHVYECTKWTNNRDITCIDWSPTHKELIVTGYHMPGATNSSSMSYYDKTTAAGAAATRSSTKTSFPKIPSAGIVPQPGETQQADGLALVWNLAMTQRPEHIFTCGSPILHTKFHPTESHLLVGGTHSGQLVVWDRRMGRLPVQRSSLSTVANKLKGHSHPICSLEIAEGGSGLVTADTNGKVNFWSLANLRDPAESINLPNCNISALAVAPETNTLLLGDEIGGFQSILPSNMKSASTATTTSSSRNSSSSGRRTVKKLNGGHEDRNGHFGMITGISTKILPPRHLSHHHSTSRSVSRGFLTGSQGLVLTCGVDWSTKLWAPAYKEEPILSFFSHSYDYMADVQWSPTNPSVFATASCKGTLGLWNLANDLDEPMTGPEGIPIDMDTPSSSSNRGGLNKLKWSADGRRIAVASSDRLHILGMTEEVSKPKPEDETKMIHNLTSRGFLEDL